MPLIEIVSEPDIRTPQEAVAYLQKLRAVIALHGHLRLQDERGFPALRREPFRPTSRAEPFGTRTEMKNLNSFQSVQRAIEEEYRRQVEAVERGETIVQETRRFDQQTGKTSAMRRKENANDYRYFPDPDLAPIVTGEDTLAAWRQELPVLPDQRKARYMADYGLTAYAAEQLVSEKALAEYFEAACESTAAPKTLANLMLTEVFRLLPPESTAIPLAPAHLGRLADMVEQGDISAGVAKRAVAALWEQDQDPDAWVEAAGLRQLNDPALLRTYAEQAMAEHPDLVAGYYKGKVNLAKALMGAAMGLSGGKANPALLQRLMDEALEKGREAGK